MYQFTKVGKLIGLVEVFSNGLSFSIPEIIAIDKDKSTDISYEKADDLTENVDYLPIKTHEVIIPTKDMITEERWIKEFKSRISRADELVLAQRGNDILLADKGYLYWVNNNSKKKILISGKFQTGSWINEIQS